MSNYSDQHYGSSREYYNNKDYNARGATNSNTTGNSTNTAYNAYAADNNTAGMQYGIPTVPATTPQLDLTQVASLIAQSPQALNLLLALQQVQQLGVPNNGPASSGPSYPNNNSAGYSSNSSGYNNSAESTRTRSHGSDYGYGGRESSDRSDRKGREDRSSSGGHGRRDREQHSSSRRGVPPEKRDGDWICTNDDCRNLNFSWRTECHLCHAPRDQSAARDQSGQGGDNHGEYNQRSSEGRDYISYERPSYRNTDTRHSHNNNSDTRRGADWHCPDPKCGHFNFSKRDRCQRCSAARPSDRSTDVPRDFGNSGSSGNYPSGGTGYSDRRRERRDRPY